ncbi:cyclic nucleotide-binding domain-containing protein [Solimonas marina]|uniref:Cyclic nucleotide-binding domain-containing protein n=1 Tax=Solimonas marina TaxID=2714601 RepID=A0A970B9A5_9GAMM|nr:cyclic nucleotide-binding domain-containing protein [Solimonas marina]NKF23124.1 cyclic nucleotide-binding domain-containing protein [Solimonas marina]
MRPHAIDPTLFRPLEPLNTLHVRRQRELARHARLRRVPAGSQLFRCGDDARDALFLIEGELQLEHADGALMATVRAGDDSSTRQLAPESPRRCSARCRTPCRILTVDAHLLDVLLNDQHDEALVVRELDDAPVDADDDWMAHLLQQPVFRRIPAAQLQTLFERMQAIDVETGAHIVEQAAIGDYFYIVITGRCQVIRERPGLSPLHLAELGPGAGFGEEALLADEPRNASVRALKPTQLMRLSRADFRMLLSAPVEWRLNWDGAQRRVRDGFSVWLDVRLPGECRAQPLPGAVELPLHLLRPKLAQLDRAQHYIVCCSDGRRSAAAAFVLAQHGYDACTLDGGLPPQR